MRCCLMVRISEEVINELWSFGAERWTKYGYDRLYINKAGNFLLNIEYKKRSSGSIIEATMNGEMISNRSFNRITADLSKTYIDLDKKVLVVPSPDKFNLKPLLTDAINQLYMEVHYGKEN